MRPRFFILLIIFLLAITVRLTYLEQIKDDVLFNYPFADSGDYHRTGMELAGKIIPGGVSEKAIRIPFYDNFLAAVYKIMGPDVYFAALAQSFLGAAACCLIYLLGRNVFSNKVGMLAGIIAALYWPLAAFGAKTLPVNLAIFFSLLALLFIDLFHEEGKWVWGFAGGASLAFAALSRPNILLLFPAFLVWILFAFRGRKARIESAVYALALAAGFLAVLIPAGAKDYAARKELIPVQRNYASTLYMGTGLETVSGLRPGSAWKSRMIELLRKDLVSREERDAYWFGEIRKVIVGGPVEYFIDSAKRIYLLLNYYEFAPYENINYFRKKSRFLSLPLLNFGSIAAFSLLGIFFIAKEDRSWAAPLYVFAAVYFISLLPFLPLARYRLTAVPVLIIFAAHAIVNISEAIRLNSRKYLLKCALLFIPLFIITNSGIMLTYAESFSRPDYYVGRAYLAMGEAAKALFSLEEARRKHPADADIYEAMGDVFQKLGDAYRAEASYKKALEINSDFPGAMEKLAVVYAKKGDLDRAIALLNKVLSSFPVEYASTHVNLATCYTLKGETKSAERELEKALEIDPYDLQALYKLTGLYERTGDPRAAELGARLDEISQKYSPEETKAPLQR